MRKVLRDTAALVLLMGILSVVQGTLWKVPRDFYRIQDALNASDVQSGDTVQVLPGRYFENINFNGKDVLLHGGRDIEHPQPESVIIDGVNNQLPVVTFESHETRSAILRGFTITHGAGKFRDFGMIQGVEGEYRLKGNAGGGIYIIRSNPVIENCIIKNNTTEAMGGGIMIDSTSFPLIKGNTIMINGLIEQYSAGGGIAIFHASAEIVNNVIASNNVIGSGGGIYTVFGGYVLIQGNTITGNTANQSGGGISISCMNSKIYGNLIIGNTVTGDGVSPQQICEFGGGGILLWRDTNNVSKYYCEVANNLIVNNEVMGEMDYYGGGVLGTSIGADLLDINFYSNTIDRNDPEGIAFCEYVNLNIMDNLITSNAGTGIELMHPRGEVFIDYNDVWNNNPDYGDSVIPGPNDISIDPQYIDPLHFDYHLSPNSPCIDMGTNCAWIDYEATDYEGKFRFVEVIQNGYECKYPSFIDIGAYEYAEGERLSCGDANNDCRVNVSDAVFILRYLIGGSTPCPYLVGDVNLDSKVEFADAVYIVNYVAGGGPPPCEPNFDVGISERNIPIWMGEPIINDTGLVEIPISLNNYEPIAGFEVDIEINPAEWKILDAKNAERSADFSIIWGEVGGTYHFYGIYSGEEGEGKWYIEPGVGTIMWILARHIGGESILEGIGISSGKVGTLDNRVIKTWVGSVNGGVQSSKQVTLYRTYLDSPKPNPTSGKVTIPFSLASDMYITIKVYNPSGRLVKDIYQGKEKAGWHTVTWYCNGPQGVYFVVLKAGSYQATRRLLKMR